MKNNFLIQRKLNAIKNICFTQEQLLKMLENNTLDNLHYKLFQFQSQLNLLSKLFNLGEDQWSQLIKEAQDNVTILKKQIITFYMDFFQKNDTIGNIDVLKNPHIIIILGTNSPFLLKQRMNVAASLYKKYAIKHILVSGGGFNGFFCEAHYMQEQLIALGIPKEAILLETDSMDTIGNALFSYLMLQKLQKTIHCQNIIVITSDFHAVRSYDIFKKIFDTQTYQVLFHTAPTELSYDRLVNLSHNELNSDFHSMETIFTYSDVLKNEPIQPGDTNSLLLSLVLSHDLYKSRSDLLRKYFLKDTH